MNLDNGGFRPFCNQWLVMLPLICHHLAIGFVLAFPAALTPALVSNGHDIRATKEEASWAAASYNMTGSIGFIILPALMQVYGRKFINVFMNLIVLFGWVVIGFAPNVNALIAGRAVQGLAFGGLYISSLLAAEYTHPKRRGFFTAFQITATGIGELICHGFGFSVTWRQLAGLGAIPAAIAILCTGIWPESPSWLAYKGRYEECREAFEWLRGADQESKNEVRELIATQRELRNFKRLQKRTGFLWTLKALKTKEFLKPFTIVLLLIILTEVSGRHYLIAYLIQIMVNLNKSRAYYYTITLDILKVLAVLLSSFVVMRFRRKPLLFNTAIVSCILLFFMCLAYYFVDNDYLIVAWMPPLLLIIYNFVCYVGLIPVSIVLKAELFPLEYKGVGMTLSGIVYSLLSMGVLRVTSIMLDEIKIHGTFAVFLLISTAVLGGLYFILPETKDRTLQDIELDFISVPSDCSDKQQLMQNSIKY